MAIVVLPCIRRVVWLAAVCAALWLLSGCVDKHRDDNHFITPYGYSTTQPFG